MVNGDHNNVSIRPSVKREGGNELYDQCAGYKQQVCKPCDFQYLGLETYD